VGKDKQSGWGIFVTIACREIQEVLRRQILAFIGMQASGWTRTCVISLFAQRSRFVAIV
jgi:hypothetical protein